MLIERVQKYFESRQYYAETFEEYGLQGTPSTILIDKRGTLRQIMFAQSRSHEQMVKELLRDEEEVVQPEGSEYSIKD
jgi:hypothetical protein